VKRYKQLFETNISIPKNTQKVIADRIKDKKYIANSGILKVSFADYLEIVKKLQGILKSDPSDVQVKSVLDDLQRGQR